MRTFTVDEAAEVLHCSPRRVAALCKTKQLVARKPGKSWVITDSAIESYLAGDMPKDSDVATTRISSARYPIAPASTNAAAELQKRIEQLTAKKGSKR